MLTSPRLWRSSFSSGFIPHTPFRVRCSRRASWDEYARISVFPTCIFRPVPRGPYSGVYGSWEVTDADIKEVWTYRAGLTVATAAFVAVTAAHALPHDQDLLQRAVENSICAAGSLGLGVSLALIHIYVSPLKKMLQIFWGTGMAGGAFLMITADSSLPVFVMENPWSIWLVGPLFAALTGVCFKEGFCYGKFEAFLLSLVLPVFLLGHLSGLLPETAERGFAVLASALLTVFAARKYTQPVKDDIGDGSVFNFMKLSPEEQEAVVARLRDM